MNIFVGKSAALIQTIVSGVILGRKRIETPEGITDDVLLRWSGSEGESHEVWFPADQIKVLED